MDDTSKIKAHGTSTKIGQGKHSRDFKENFKENFQGNYESSNTSVMK